MKQLLTVLALLLGFSTSAFAAPEYLQGGGCAVVAAEAARVFAANRWNTAEGLIKIQVSEIVHSSNSVPVEVYAVGLLSPSGVPVLFTVAVKNDGGNCKVVDVDFAEFLD